MSIKISFTHKNLSPKEKQYAEQYVMEKVAKVEKRVPIESSFLRVRIERFVKKAAYNVELALSVPKGSYLASEDDHTIPEAVDFVFDKLLKQIKKSGGLHSPSHHKFPRARAVKETLTELARMAAPLEAAQTEKEEFFETASAVLKPLVRTLQHEIRLRGLEGEEELAPEDIADEAIIAAWDGRRKKPGTLSVRQWLYQVALTLFDAHAKRLARGRQEDSLEEVVPEETEASQVSNLGDEVKDYWQPDELTTLADTLSEKKKNGGMSSSQRALYHRVLAALTGVRPQARQAFLLKFKEGFEADEIAMIQRRSLVVVEKDMAETIASLRARFN